MQPFSRRSLLSATALAATTPLIRAANSKVVVGLELFSVRKELAEDLNGTLAAVAKMGYQGVEFFSPYFAWTPEKAKEVRKYIDGLGLKCLSTHNSRSAFTGDGIDKAVELNTILGSRFIVMASAGRMDQTEAAWKGVADSLQGAVAKFKAAKMLPGFHNHELEFKPLAEGGKRPIEIIAANTSKDVVLQLDVGTCVEVGYDPVAWIKQNPGRIKSIHCKDWSKEKGFQALFAEGAAPWVQIFKTAQKVGGVEHYLIEQEGSPFPPFETAQKCLNNYKSLIKKV
ncbi:MAG: sugar phosphate isomerase/epimerase [Acidobacteria bacterium]|nr:sugar phosphate isomerase/epimerase [Acidobacteriota bacterium]